MSTSVNEQIRVLVKARFEEDHSKPSKQDYLFSYHIIIENNSDYAVQLMSRHWYIFDSNGEYHEVKGEGVIGEQPIILAHHKHEYDSFCQLQSDIGMMWGNYLMKKVDDNKLFEVKIPEFQLIVPNRLN